MVSQSWETFDIVNILLNILIICLLVFCHIQLKANDCRAQLESNTKSSGGETYLRKAQLSIHDNK